MTLRYADSFDLYTTTAQLNQRWGFLYGTPAIQAGGGRFGTNSVRITNGAHGLEITIPGVGAGAGTLIAGFSYFFTAYPNGDEPIPAFRDAGIHQGGVFFTPSGNLVAKGGAGTVLATAPNPLLPSTSYYIECKVIVHNTTGRIVVRVNGATVIDVNNVDTQGTANATANRMLIGASAGNPWNADIDDLYICDSAGTANNDFLGDCRVQARQPNGAGGNTAWTTVVGDATHFGAVDEATPDDDTTYIASATAGQIDTFAMADLTPTAGTVRGCQVVLVSRKDDGGVRTLQPELRIGGVNYLVGAALNIGAVYAPQLDVLEVSPASAAAFTIAEVNGMEAGVNMVA